MRTFQPINLSAYICLPMENAYLSLGSNEGDRLQWIQQTLELLGASCGTIIKISSIYETAAWGITEQPDFLNLAIVLETTLPPHELLAEILKIETSLGRRRDVKWGPRIIDIDILLYNNAIINTPELTIPHPFLHKRRFTLVPLAEIAPMYEHPLLHRTINELLAVCEDKLEVHKYAFDRV